MFRKLLKKGQAGFTIIEVMIVLAIAGLIMVVVLVAVPQLQRSQRNSATTAVLDRTFTELQNYATNNNGNYPSGTTNQDGFCERYLSKTANCSDDSTAAFVNDPRTGTSMDVQFLDDVDTDPEDFPSSGEPRTITVYVTTGGAKCEGETVTDGNGARQIAAVVPLEGGAYACRDNQ